VKPNTDGSYTMWFEPKHPQDHEGSWIRTMPDKSLNVLFRLYAPLKPWFDKNWKPGDFERIVDKISCPCLVGPRTRGFSWPAIDEQNFPYVMRRNSKNGLLWRRGWPATRCGVRAEARHG
jgi:hypothetical protein